MGKRQHLNSGSSFAYSGNYESDGTAIRDNNFCFEKTVLTVKADSLLKRYRTGAASYKSGIGDGGVRAAGEALTVPALMSLRLEFDPEQNFVEHPQPQSRARNLLGHWSVRIASC